MSKTYNAYHMKTYAKRIYENGFRWQSGKVHELQLVALYMRDELDIPVNQIKEKLMEFCRKQFPYVPDRGHAVSVANAAKYAQKKENVLIECPYIDMYESEIEYIDGLSISENAKKVMFAIMVHKKLDKFCYEARNIEPYKLFSYSINKRYSSLKRVAKLSKVKDVGEVMHELYCHNLIDVIETKGTPFKLNFVDKFAFDGKIAIRVSDYEGLGLYWEWLMGKTYISVCSTCWKVYSTRSKRRCYCEEHQGYQKIGIDTKQIVCDDCGSVFEVSIKNTKSKRCENCRTKHKLQYDAERMKKIREGKKDEQE